MTFADFDDRNREHNAAELETGEAPKYDDDNWEDVKPQRPSPPASVRSAPSTPRRRRTGGTRTIYVAASSPRNTASPPRRQLRPKPKPPTSSFSAREEWEHIRPHLRSILGYFIRVVVDAFRLHRPLFSIALTMFMAYLVFMPIFSLTRTLTSPLCSVPILNRAVPFCSWGVGTSTQDDTSPKWADYPKLVDIQSSSFEQLLDESVGGSGLALEVKKAEMATSDLVTLVRVSDLRSRDALAQALVNFIEDAKKTGRGLQSLSAKINGAVDTVLAVNDYALNTIEAASIPKSLASRVLNPFSVSVQNPTKEAVKETFINSMESLSEAMQRCIMEAQVSLANLDKLEQHLSLLHEIVTREDGAINLAKSEVLSELWTTLGGNRRRLRGIDNHLMLLRGVSGYRKRALAHVVATLQTLGALSADMEELRSRVAAPDIVGDKIPVEVHVKSIRSGLERLKDGQMRAREREDETIRRVMGIGN